MAQENGLPFKLVYSHWYKTSEGEFPVANGLHPSTAEWIINHIQDNNLLHDNRPFLRINKIDSLYFYNVPDSGHFFRHSDFYYHFEKKFLFDNVVKESEVNDSDAVYFYPIELDCNATQFLTGQHPFVLNGQSVDYVFKNTFTDGMLNLIKTGRVKILFVNIIDPCTDIEVLDAIEHMLEEIGIPAHHAVFLQGNTKTDYKGKLQIIGSKISLYQISNQMDKYPHNTGLGYISDYVREQDIDATAIRSNKFLSFNRIMRPHRVALCYLAIKHELLDTGTFSFLHIVEDSVVPKLSMLVDRTDQFDIIAEKIHKLVPLEIDTHHLDTASKKSFYTVDINKKDLYSNSYVHITTETQFDQYSTPFFSEKTWRPILNLQPFIYLGNYKALNTLRTLGFKTFHPFIDESYDQEPDPKKRFSMIETQIKKFAHMTTQQVHDWYHSITDILLHNQQLLYTFKNYNPVDELLQHE